MLEFNEKEHKYLLDGRELIPITRLMREYGLAPNYDGVAISILEKKAEYGTLIHKEIEEYIKDQKIGFTSELSEFIDYTINHDVKFVESEKIVNNDITAGTIDLVLQEGDQKIIADIKTTYTLHSESVSWQISLYLYLYDLDHYTDYKGQCYHYNKDKHLEVIDIPIKNREMVEELMDCVRLGKPYKPELDIAIISEMNVVNQTLEKYQRLVKQAENEFNALKDVLYNEMKAKGITSYKDDTITISIVASSTKKIVDSKLLKEEYPDVYDKVLKDSTTKESIRIKFKEIESE